MVLDTSTTLPSLFLALLPLALLVWDVPVCHFFISSMLSFHVSAAALAGVLGSAVGLVGVLGSAL